MRDPLVSISALATPQTRPIPGRTDQVRNAAGGYVFPKDDWTRLEDFLILGTTGGTYYTDADALTTANADVLFAAITADGPRVVQLITEIATARPARAPKPRPYLFALAAAAAQGDPATVQAVKHAFPAVVRTTDHLATFFGYWKNLAGKPSPRGTQPVIGRAMRTALASWFNADQDVHPVALRALKARQRATPTGEPMALRDIIRISHPTGRTEAHRALIGWLAGKVGDEDARTRLRDVDDFLTAQAVATPGEAVGVITQRHVPWEFLPSAVLGDAQVWDALIDAVGLTALIRNLGRMTRLGTLGPFTGDATGRVIARLTDASALAAARVHPMDLYLALKAYQAGATSAGLRRIGGRLRRARSQGQEWQPVGAICDALETAYDLSFQAVTPSGKRLLVAVDCSGSMAGGWMVVSGGSPLGTPYEVANTLAVLLARIEPDLHVIEMDTQVHRSRVTPRANLREVAGWRPAGGGTDLSLPFTWAQKQKLAVDVFVVLTDNETWAGRTHPRQALDAYRRVVNPAARVIVVSMTAVGYTIADPGDDGVLNVAGLDAALPTLITGYVRGSPGPSAGVSKA
jgi:60 kDa SS-A/Ro ribonucleoprotein